MAIRLLRHAETVRDIIRTRGLWPLLLARPLATMATVAMLAACTRGEGGDADSAQRLSGGSADRCLGAEITVDFFPADSLPLPQQCQLVRTAISELGRASSDSGLDPADTAAIDGATVTGMVMLNPGDVVLKSSWNVSLHLRRPYDVEVILDRSGGAAIFRRSHKPLGGGKDPP